MPLLASPVGWVGPRHALEVFGVRLVGVSVDTGKKLLFSFALVAALLVASWLLRRATALFGRRSRVRFWANQVVALAVGTAVTVGLLSIWLNDPKQMATAIGLVTAGLAFALQKVVTAFAGYVVILRGKTFTVGDRITMGGVRGDVIGLGFIQTRIMEMGQPPAVEAQADPAMWVQSRQYTGRIVTVTNDKIFDEPVYNYTREFPFIWEELRLPIPYSADRARAEQILVEAAARHTVHVSELGEAALRELERRYALAAAELGPRVYHRLTDNWLELAVRFLVPTSGVREIKSDMSREILAALDEAGIAIASSTFEVVGVPPLRLEVEEPQQPAARTPDGDARRH